VVYSAKIRREFMRLLLHRRKHIQKKDEGRMERLPVYLEAETTSLLLDSRLN
jgi:hypothetical protein